MVAPTNHKKKVKNLVSVGERRRDLRNESTSAEATLWLAIKNRKLAGRKFRRQYSVGNYILDFYCPEENLAIELDGQVHFSDSAMERDARRKDYLRKNGIRVLRFENKWVFEELEWLLQIIEKNFGWDRK